eukprot:TRINITY_DN1780_c0_g1_i4.p1 TRINITY_DN1780_c0_g1~~TRINITY_DN1780_c0_g1_i4.p1  ORF type:complete len:562 (+),score=39.53 TRINITY_DN1780_c0_g1_i4:230-1687(+)
MQRADSNAKRLKETGTALHISSKELWWSFVGFSGKAKFLISKYQKSLTQLDTYCRTTGLQNSLNDVCEVHRDLLRQQVRLNLRLLNLPVATTAVRHDDQIAEHFSALSNELIMREKHRYAVHLGLFHSLLQNTKNQIKSFLLDGPKNTEEDKGYLFSYVSEDMIGDIGIVIVVCTLYRLPLVLNKPWVKYNVRHVFVTQFFEILSDLSFLLQCIWITIGMKYLPRLIMDGFETIYYTGSLSNLRIVSVRLANLTSIDLQVLGKSTHLKNGYLIFLLPVVMIKEVTQSGSKLFSESLYCSIFGSLLAYILFCSFYRVVDVFTCWQFELCCYVVGSLPLIICLWDKQLPRKPVPWKMVRPVWVNYIQFLSTGLQAAQLFSLYMLSHVEYHAEWENSWVMTFSRGCMLTGPGYGFPVLVFVLPLVYLSVIVEIVSTVECHGYLFVFANMIGEGLLFGIARWFHESDYAFHVFSIIFLYSLLVGFLIFR